MSLLVITRLMWHRNDTNVSLSDDAITSNEDEVNHSASWDSVGVRHDVEGNNRSALSDQTDNLATDLNSLFTCDISPLRSNENVVTRSHLIQMQYDYTSFTKLFDLTKSDVSYYDILSEV